MKIAIASDHGGFELKNTICDYLTKAGYEICDMGCDSTDSVNYPDYAFGLCEKVAKGEFDKGILICGTGIGMSICANKVKGIRCALCSEPVSAALTRRHNDSNVLAMGARIIGSELAKEIVNAFLTTEFEGGRHETRVKMISDYENK